MINLMIIDDSALVRQVLTEVFEEARDIKVVCTAGDPFQAATKLKNVTPDVILLDVEMPKMDGITFLKKLMAQHPIPVIICSTLVGDDSQTHIQALESGAVDIIVKPITGMRAFSVAHKERFHDSVRAAARAKVKQIREVTRANSKFTADAVLKAPSNSRPMLETTEKVILIGASTGGTEAIRTVLMQMPVDCPAITVVQHMPAGFTRSFAKRLNEHCAINVVEGEAGMSLLRGRAIIAPGDKHMVIKRSGAKYLVDLLDGPPVSRHRPSVDVLLRSAAKSAGSNATAVILTGMGDDGATGLLELKNAGGATFAQDEATSVVFGMPKMAFERGGASKLLPLQTIASTLLLSSK